MKRAGVQGLEETVQQIIEKRGRDVVEVVGEMEEQRKSLLRLLKRVEEDKIGQIKEMCERELKEFLEEGWGRERRP